MKRDLEPSWSHKNHITNLQLIRTFGIGRPFTRRADVQKSLSQEIIQISRLVPRRPVSVDITWSHRTPSRAAASHFISLGIA